MPIAGCAQNLVFTANWTTSCTLHRLTHSLQRRWRHIQRAQTRTVRRGYRFGWSPDYIFISSTRWTVDHTLVPVTPERGGKNGHPFSERPTEGRPTPQHSLQYSVEAVNCQPSKILWGDWDLNIYVWVLRTQDYRNQYTLGDKKVHVHCWKEKYNRF